VGDTAGKPTYEVRLASADSSGAGAGAMKVGSHEFEGAVVRVVAGDFAPHMAAVARHLRAAAEVAANDHQRAMLAHYVASFETGDLYRHIAGSREWVKDVGPAVESYLGFIESYRDPLGVRGEWEGFVAVVDRATSRKFASLVDSAERLLTRLPWGAAFEKDTFVRPDFTSLEVLAFASSGVPAGINIPNYTGPSTWRGAGGGGGGLGA
jgi:dipeptidyl-peptidase III